jgi:hypothetical protein
MAIIVVSDHAYIRIKQRMGLGHGAANKIAETAFEEGISHSETTGRLNKYISGQMVQYPKQGLCVKIYGEMVYFFGSTRKTETGECFAVLVTVIYIPNNLKNSALGLQKRKKRNNSDVAGEYPEKDISPVQKVKRDEKVVID